MSYVEFLVFLCRITHFHYEESKHRKEPLYIKLDHLIHNFLATKDMIPSFTLGILFQTEAKEWQKKYKKKKRMLKCLKIKGQNDEKLALEIKEIGISLNKTGIDIDQIDIGDIEEESEEEILTSDDDDQFSPIKPTDPEPAQQETNTEQKALTLKKNESVGKTLNSETSTHKLLNVQKLESNNQVGEDQN